MRPDSLTHVLVIDRFDPVRRKASLTYPPCLVRYQSLVLTPDGLVTDIPVIEQSSATEAWFLTRRRIGDVVFGACRTLNCEPVVRTIPLGTAASTLAATLTPTPATSTEATPIVESRRIKSRVCVMSLYSLFSLESVIVTCATMVTTDNQMCK